MRMRLKFNIAEPELDADFRVYFVSFFKKALTEYRDGRLYDIYYAPAAQKPFTFAPILFGAQFDKDKLDVSKQRIDVVWSTGDSAAGIDFYNAFHKQLRKDFLLPDSNAMCLQKIVLEHEQNVDSDKISIHFLSPLCLRNHDKNSNKDMYLSSERAGFHQLCREIVSNQVKGTLTERSLENFTIQPVQARKTVIRYHKGMIEASSGYFRLEGDPALLSFLYQYGIGSRRSAGFGCFNII
ncbi:MAG: CRISPR-associated endoribonuclease Cas6 [Clostridiales bacterium]|nr:CRISPR-associated endoribonuclease Cas6 [Clostridiales bacterium]